RERPPPPLSEATVNAFKAQSWPGNVRELSNRVDLAFSLGAPSVDEEEEATRREDAFPVDLNVPLHVALERIKDAYERAYVEQALAEAGGNISKGAKRAGVGRNHFREIMMRHGLHRALSDVNL